MTGLRRARRRRSCTNKQSGAARHPSSPRRRDNIIACTDRPREYHTFESICRNTVRVSVSPLFEKSNRLIIICNRHCYINCTRIRSPHSKNPVIKSGYLVDTQPSRSNASTPLADDSHSARAVHARRRSSAAKAALLSPEPTKSHTPTAPPRSASSTILTAARASRASDPLA